MRIKVLVPAMLAAAFANDARAESGDSAVTMGSVDVRQGGRGQLAANRVLTSVDVLGGDQVENKNVMNSWELLGQMPGIQLTETRQGTESGKATFRAFNGEGYINGIKILIDGVPSNVNSGNQRFIDMVFPLEIDYIEVVRGTNDPRYGLHNIGGNINFGTRQGGNYTDGRLTYGSFDTREAQLAVGREADGFAQNYFVGVQDSNGYRDHDTSQKYSLGGKWFVGSDADTAKLGLVARAYHHEADEPGFMTAEELATDRTASAAKNANDGADRDMRHLGVHLDLRLSDTLHFNNKLYYNSYEETRRVTFTSFPTGNAPRQQREWDEKQTGMLSTITWRQSELLTLEGGANVEHQDNGYRRLRFAYSVPTDFNAPPARVQNDDRYTLENVGAYVQAVLAPTAALKIVPAFRVDRFSGDTRLPGGVTAPLQHTGWIEQPKLSVVYSFNPGLHVYANWGKTFQVLTGSTAPAYLTAGQETFRPSINTGQEVGIKFTPAAGTEARLAVWQQDATDEVANMPATGTTVGLGETRRRGVDLQVSSHLGEHWVLWASHAYQEAKVISAFTTAGDALAGNEVIATPRYISNIGADYRPNAQWTFGVQGRMQGDYYIEERNTQGKFGGFALVDMSARYQVSERISLDLQVRNLFGREYAYTWYDNFFWGGNDQPMFSPAPGRTAFLSFNVKL
ncbi:TonB-dependent receptor [Xanthomonas campestris]|uniref:TonB-dependent receptor n=1 Tax=Xanthomonas campestris TaxID=339 RepID=UPI00096DC05E|nr:TonB-dependent receptor [Xanthomonas campestris]MCF8826495.1 TonB-dependent receptor [Xanthomonas campestris pv. raphani]MEA9934489.1 TonB-dependent receptor [Xanthomonas campestris pv. raphani]QLC69894.1 TonB-dependent receptor [Xanthomonas campestris pv. raphani]